MPKFHRWFQRIAIPAISLAFHIHFKLKITGRENIPKGGCVVCPNHNSLSDPPLTAVALTGRGNLAVMAKKELFAHPQLGPLITWLGAFPVDRTRADITAIKAALQAVKDGRKLVVFPQGTRGAGEDEAKEGAAMLAARSKAPILPIYITEKKERFGRVQIVIGKPFMPEEGSRDYAAIAEDIVHRIYALKPENEQ